MKLQEEPPEKKTKTKSPPPPSPPSSIPSFSLLPDEITVNYLARISRPYYPRLSTVSRSFRSVLSSTELYAARSHIGITEQCLYVSIWEANRFPQWFTLWINPNRSLPSSSVIKRTGNLLVPIPPSNTSNSSVVVVGSEIYVIGGLVGEAPSSAVRILDCRSHTWRDGPSMNVARVFAHLCVHDGKIYVLGGSKGVEDGRRKRLEDDEAWAEVFDTKTRTWECLPEPGSEVRKCHIFRIAEMEGKINFGNNLGSVNEIYSYDPEQGKWERCENASETFLLSECVIENVSYSCRYHYHSYYGPTRCWWYDVKVGIWKQVKGLESFEEKHSGICRKGDFGSGKIVSCDGKLLLVWEVCMRHRKKIWCAEIKVEKRDGGEIWGNVEWDDVLLTIPTSRVLLHCLSVSV